jgi:hypothetical protein
MHVVVPTKDLNQMAEKMIRKNVHGHLTLYIEHINLTHLLGTW